LGFSKYPNQIDDGSSLPVTTDLVTQVRAEVVNRLRDAVLATQAELGTQPSGIFGNVRARLDDLRSEIETIKAELGPNPSGTFDTVQDRLADVDVRIAAIQVELTSINAAIAALDVRLTLVEDTNQIIIPLAINAQIDVSVFSAIGGDEVGPSALPTLGRTITFISRISTTDVTISADIRLFNITDGVIVAITSASGVSLTPERREVVLSSGGVSNDAGWVIDAEKTYEVQLKMSAATGTDSVFCQKAEIIITWT